MFEIIGNGTKLERFL